MGKLSRCQLIELENLSIGNAYPLWFLSPRHVYRSFTARLNVQLKRRIKAFIRNPLKWTTNAGFSNDKLVFLNKQIKCEHHQLQKGDTIRVKSFEEIRSMLNPDWQFCGCSFMPEMACYCGTLQKVFQPVHKFVDERDRLVKRSKGVVLLEGVHCLGTDEFGPCDRSCFYFWREEWLEKIE